MPINLFSMEASDCDTSKIKSIIQDGYEREIKNKVHWWCPAIAKMGGPRAAEAFNHSLLKEPRKIDDLASGKIARVDVWKYQYKDPRTGEIITDTKPISTQKKYWKIDDEARIISMTFYGSIQKYFQGLLDFFDSTKYIKKVNEIDPSQPWGYETFTVRIYVAQRNPANSTLGPLQNATDPAFIKLLLDRGCEIAFVDNHLAKVGRDATFWRFLIADERMKNDERIRYLVRDVDHKVTAAEYFSVGEWMGSWLRYHRMHFSTAFVGPLTASIFGGTHEGNEGIKDIVGLIECFPYRFIYGDDEIFTKYVIWMHMKKSGSILTHKYKRGASFQTANLYEGSTQDEPTINYCGDVQEKFPQVIDLLMPKGIKFPLIYLAYDVPLKKLEEEYFNLVKIENPRVKNAVHNLGARSVSQTRGLPILCGEAQEEPEIIEMYGQIQEAARCSLVQ